MKLAKENQDLFDVGISNVETRLHSACLWFDTQVWLLAFRKQSCFTSNAQQFYLQRPTQIT